MASRTLLPPDLRCAVTLGVDFDGPSHEVGRGIAPLGTHSWGRYSGRRGIPRIMEMLQRQGVPCTFFVPGYDAECHPELVKEMDRAGFEVAAHGYLHEAWDVPKEEETALLRRTDDLLRQLIGKPILGWRSPSGRKTANTMHVLKSMGYLYDSSDKDYDLPYVVRVDGKPVEGMMELPSSAYALDDFPFYKFSMTPPSEVLAHWQQEFDTLYHENGYFMLMVHPRSGWGSGTPARARIMEDMIRFIKGYQGVRFFQVGELARWCLDNRQFFD